MNPITTTKEVISENTQLVQKYAEQEYEYAQMKVFYQISSLSSSIAKKTIIGTLLLVFTVFLSIALAIYIGEQTGQMATGFLWVAAVYFLLVVVSILLRKKVEKYIINQIAKKYF